ncbi:MAG: zinc-binding alcohol dehydrogenase family protein [Erysipelotrichaceae bacterium]
MKAIGLNENLPIDDERSLMDVEVPKPTAKGKDLLVKVMAIAVNPVDTKMRKNRATVNAPQILGWDVAGIVEATGEACELFRPGDEVYYAGELSRPGCYSEYHLVDERIVGKKPASLDFEQSAAIPLTGITAYESLFDRLRVGRKPAENKGKTILIIGAAGGVGSMALQLAKNAGLTVIGTASRPESIQWVKAHGADAVINHYEAFKSQLTELSIQGVEYILCLNATATHWNNMAEVIKPQGSICSIVDTDAPINLNLLKPKSVGFTWEFMFTRSMFKTEDMIKQHLLLNDLSAMIDLGVIKTTVNQVMSPINAQNLRKAHKSLEEGRTIGKIVLSGF